MSARVALSGSALFALAVAATVGSTAAMAQPAPIDPVVPGSEGTSSPASQAAEQGERKVTRAGPQPSEQDGGLEVITVTAQRRAESLINVPLSIQAVGADTLQKQGVARIEELQNSIIGMTMQYGSNGFLTPFIRGVGNAVAGNYAENSVAIYIDDVPRPRSSSSTELANVERVEVLKGPQGALYGRNATGGAINIVTKEPDQTFAAIGRLTGGGHKTLEAQGYVNVPLGDALAFNVTYSHRERDGLIKNRSLYSSNPLRPRAGDPLQIRVDPNFSTPARGPRGKADYEDRNSDTVDAKLRLDVTDDIKVVLRGDFTNLNDTGTTGWINPEPEVVAATLTGITGIVFTPEEIPTGKPGRSSIQDQQGFKFVKDYGGSVKIEADLPGVTLTSITAKRWNTLVGSSEVDATQIPLAGFTADFSSESFSQELRAVSNGDDPFQWIVGGTYFRDNVDDAVAGEVGTILFPGGATGLTKEQILAGQFPRATLPNLFSELTARAKAVFAQASYEFGDFEVIASGRYAWERRKVVFEAQALTGGIAFTGRRKEKAFTPAVTLNYNIPSGGLVFARWAKGFKSGGLNNLLNPTANVGGLPVGIDSFKPEKLTSYELGYKADLFSRRLRVVAGVYYYDYADLQTARTLSAEATSVVFNADKARVKGAELELTGRIAPGITLAVGGAYTDGEYKDFRVDDIVSFDASGNRMLNTPKWQFQSTLDVTQPISANLVFAGSANVSWRSSLFFDPENTEALRQDGYAVVNGRLGVRTANDRVGAYIWAKNLFNKTYAIFGQHTLGFGGFKSFGDRRIIGGTVEMKF